MITQRALQRLIGRGLILLLALMPFHAFGSVWLGHLFGHEALFQAWKEVVIAGLALLTIALVVINDQARDRLRSWPVMLIGLFIVTALTVTLGSWPGLTAAAFGAKIDFEFLVCFVIALVVADANLIRTAIWTILISSSIVFLFSVAQIYLLPVDFLARFGYGPNTIMPFEFLGSWTGPFRFSSTLGGPNQLGTFTLLPMALAATIAIRKHAWWLWIIPALGLFSLFHTYSRGAWLGAIMVAIVLALATTSRRRAGLLAGIAATILAISYAVDHLAKTNARLNAYLFHTGTQSDQLHLQSLTVGLTDSVKRPWGHGLGTAGPAIFHSGAGHIIENYYLQLSYETGFLGLIAFISLVTMVIIGLAQRAASSLLAPATLAAIAGISVTSIFLPAWTDSSTAIIVWIAAGLALGAHDEHRHV